jgi:hypothetical protein
VKDCAREAAGRPPVEEFLAAQRRFAHLVRRDRETGAATVVPGREDDVARLRAWVHANVERLYRLAELT